MAKSLQMADMDAKEIAERQLIERYLSGQLSEEDAQAFEMHVEAHPEVIRDIETIARMKSGLMTLEKRGELAALLQPAVLAWYRRPAIVAALAAGIAAVVFLIAGQVNFDRGGASLAMSLQQLAKVRGATPTVSSRVSLSRKRGILPAVVSEQPSGTAVEITLKTVTMDGGVPHTVSLLRLTDETVVTVATATKIRADAGGDLAVFVSASVLAEGSYLFRVYTEGREPQDFALRVTSTDH